MKRLTLLLSGLFLVFSSQAQEISVDNYEGQWSDDASWTNFPDPAPDFIINESENYNINGYLSIGTSTVNQDLNFSTIGGKTPPDFTIEDTLVVYGNVIHANSGHNIVVGSDALFIVFGDFTANNQIDIQSGGKFIITGNMTVDDKNKSTFSDNGGDLYVFGSPPDNTDASNARQTEAQFNSNENETLRSFVNGGGSEPLPITLKSFTATVDRSSIQLDWVTAKEENFSHFEVERAVESGDFEMIGLVEGQGNSMSDLSYEFTDYSAPAGILYYRLKAVDLDNTHEYHQVVSIENGFKGEFNVSPNPAANAQDIKLQFPSNIDGQIDYIAVYDMQGNKLNEIRSFDPASGTVFLNQNMRSGMYLMKVSHNGLEENIRFIIK